MATSLIPLKNRKRLVTYYVDTGTVYTAKIKKGADALSGLTFSPTLSGWTFVGWREDTAASNSVLSSEIVGSKDITLYAVFKKTVTLTYYSTSSTKHTATGTRYYNNGNIANPTFTISSPSVSGWTFLGWISSSTSATGTVSYESISGTTFSADATLYAKFSQTITLSYNGNSSTSGSTSSQTGTRYWNVYGNYSNPSFTLRSNGYTRTGYSFSKWAKDSASGTQYSAGDSVTLSASATFYAVWTAVDVTIFDGDTLASGYGTYYTDTIAANPDNESSEDTGTRTMFVLSGLGPFTTIKISYSYNCYVNYGTAELYINNTLVQSGSPTGLWDYSNATKTITISSSATSLTITGRAYASNDYSNTSYYARANMTITKITAHV